MILKRVKVENWRSIVSRELELHARLTVLCGDNEQGKSTLVDAIQKGLYWNSTGRKARADNLDYLVPAGDLDAKPTVELELDFDGLQVTVTKVVSPKQAHRHCRLQIRGAGRPESLEQEEAENRLKALLSAQHEASGLVYSMQMQPWEFLAERLPAVACKALTLGATGSLMTSPRLEQVRKLIEGQRDVLLKKKLDLPLSASALANTPCARARDDLRNSEEKLATLAAELDATESLRREIEATETAVAGLNPQFQAAEDALRSFEEQRRKQDQTQQELLQRQNALHTPQVELKQLEEQVQEVLQLGQAIDVAERRVQELQEQRRVMQVELDDFQRQLHEQKTHESRAQVLLDDVIQREQAIRACLDVVRKSAGLHRIRAVRERMNILQEQVNVHTRSLATIGPWPDDARIGALRGQFQEYNDLCRDAQTRLQVTLNLRRPFKILSWVDNVPQEAQLIAADQDSSLQAVRSLRLEIADTGTIDIRCGATELDELVRRMQEQSQELDQSVAEYGLTAAELPAGFDRLEELRIRAQEAQRELKHAQAARKESEKEHGKLEVIDHDVASEERMLHSAEARLEPLRARVSADLSEDQLTQEEIRLAAEHEAHARAQTHCRDQITQWQQKMNDKSREIGSLDTSLSKENAQLSQGRSRLLSLQSSGTSDEQRSGQLQQLRLKVVQCQQAVDEARQARDALGPPIEDRELQSRRDQLADLSRQSQKSRDRLTDLRAELRTRLSRDLLGQKESLEADLLEQQTRLQDEERKLAALVLFHSLLDAERKRLAQLVSEPLNRRVGPWLQLIRGQPTRLVFDDQRGQITHLISGQSGREIELPFEEHSAGLKGQLGFLLRLELAKLLAEQSGQSHFVILDDPLTETSPVRRQQMFRVLQQASDHLQIMLVTCHRDALPPSSAGQAAIIDV